MPRHNANFGPIGDSWSAVATVEHHLIGVHWSNELKKKKQQQNITLVLFIAYDLCGQRLTAASFLRL